MNDLTQGRVLEVVEERTVESTKKLLKTLEKDQLESIKAVAVDMWKPFKTAVTTVIPTADIVHDRYHISSYLNGAVDGVRRQELRQMRKDGDDSLVGSKFVFLRNPENMTAKQKECFDELMKLELNTGVAWSIKNMFREFWSCATEFSAKLFFGYWCEVVENSELKPMIKVMKMLERHIDDILNFFKHRITNAVSEGLNSKIQTIKASARGFHSFSSYRIRILFYCGKLDLFPSTIDIKH